MLSEALDEDTLNKIDDCTDLKLTTYDPVQEWILQKDSKSKARRAVRHKTGNGQDDMVYGVEDQKQQQTRAEPAPAASPGVDPWLTSADPWA